MRGAWLLLFVLVITIFCLLFASHVVYQKDGFSSHPDFVNRQLKQYNSVGISLIAGKNQGALGDDGNKYLNTVGDKQKYPLFSQPDGLWPIIDKCEAIKTDDCNAFDNPSFATDCGICLDIGTDSTNASKTGGLVLLPYDKTNARNTAKPGFLPQYKSTVGFCPAGKLVSSKAECMKLKKKKLCEQNKNFNIPGCSQCYSGDPPAFTMIDSNDSPGVITGHGQIKVIGVGLIRVQQGGNTSRSTSLSTYTPYTINITVAEGSNIKIFLTPPSDSDPDNPTIPYISGYLFGPTFSGEFSIDLRRIVLTDEITGRKPRSNGEDSSGMVRMAPGFGETTMTLSITVPFSFVESSMEEAQTCKDAPFVTTEASATFLNSDPCSRQGSAPGRYSLECLQGIWLSNGCTTAGAGYPANASRASSLMANSDGSFRTINEISDYIYNRALITSTGNDQYGRKQDIPSMSAASVFCKNREITSPCDAPNGALSTECLSYLWRNQGSQPLVNGRANPIGPTYVNTVKEGFTGGQGCQVSGDLSPIDASGKPNQAAIAHWKKHGSVQNIINGMRNVHSTASSQNLPDEKRAADFSSCYGGKLAPRPPPPAPPFYVPNNKLPTTYFIIRNNVLLNSLWMTADYKLQFVITPTAIRSNNSWGNIIHCTSTNTDYPGFGCRSPAIWFFPGSLKLHVRIGDRNDNNWGIDIDGCQLNKESSFSLECIGSSITITLDGNVSRFTQPSARYVGNLIVYGSNPWYESAGATIKNVALQLFEAPKFNVRKSKGKILWLDASDTNSLVLSGSTVNTWKDKSGRGHHATAINGPKLNSGKIVLNGHGQYFTTNYTARAPSESVFIVFSSNNRLQSSLVESSRPGGRQFQNDGHQGIGFGPGLASMGVRWIGMGTMSTTVSATSLGELLYNSSEVNIYLNGNLSKRSIGNPGFTDGLTVIGGSPGQNGYYLNGTICEVIIYDHFLTNKERQRIEGHLAWKWGFNNTLPRNHPYYSKGP